MTVLHYKWVCEYFQFSHFTSYFKCNNFNEFCWFHLGIGNIPDAVLNALHNHKDLGIHSEMFADGVVDLVAKGCVTNAKKVIHKGRIVGSFLIGTKKLYDFVDNNPFIGALHDAYFINGFCLYQISTSWFGWFYKIAEMLDIAYVNNVGIIARNPKMTAINSCIEVDITGQVCSDSIGTRMYSGSYDAQTNAAYWMRNQR